MGGRTARTLTVFATAREGDYAQQSAGFGYVVHSIVRSRGRKTYVNDAMWIADL